MPLIHPSFMPNPHMRLRETANSYEILVVSPQNPHSYEVAVAKLPTAKHKLIVQGDNRRHEFIVDPIDHTNISMFMSDAFSPYGGNILKITVPKAEKEDSYEKMRQEREAREAQKAREAAKERCEKERQAENARCNADFGPQDLTEFLAGLFNGVQQAQRSENPMDAFLKAFVPKEFEKGECEKKESEKKEPEQKEPEKKEPEKKEPEKKEDTKKEDTKKQEPESKPKKTSSESNLDVVLAEKLKQMEDKLSSKFATMYEKKLVETEKKFKEEVRRLEKKLVEAEKKAAEKIAAAEKKAAEKVAAAEKKAADKVSGAEKKIGELEAKEALRVKNLEKKLLGDLDDFRISARSQMLNSERSLGEKYDRSEKAFAEKVKHLKNEIDVRLKNTEDDVKKLKETAKSASDSDSKTEDYESVIKATSIEESPLTPSTGSPSRSVSPSLIKTHSHQPEIVEVEDEEFVMIRKKFGE